MYGLKLLFLGFLLLLHRGFANEPLEGWSILHKNQLHPKDFFAVESGVEISGEVVQDAYILGSQVTIDGVIDGDLLVMGGSVEVAGEVKGSVRAIAGQLLISGTIGKNVSVLCGNIHLAGSSVIGGNLVAAGGNLDISGKVGGEVTVTGSNVRLSGFIGQATTAFAGKLHVTSRANLNGALTYTSGNPVYIEPQAIIKGPVYDKKTSLEEVLHHRWVDALLLSSRIAGFLMNFLYTFLIGIFLMKLFPHNVHDTVHFLQKKPWKALINGIVTALLVPLLSLLLLMTILGVPFALTLIAANIIGFYTAKIYVILWWSNTAFQWMHIRTHKLLAYGLGVILYFGVLLIPYVGNAVSILSMLMGLGGLIGVQIHRGGRAHSLAPPMS